MTQENKICRKCGRILTIDRFPKNYRTCRDCTNKYNREYKQRNHAKTLSQLGIRRQEIKMQAFLRLSSDGVPKCAICGFKDNLNLLQVDHIDNDASKDRTSWGTRRKGIDVYIKILSMNPEEARKKYRLLCVFHNWAKRYGDKGNKYKVIVRETNAK